MSRFSLLNRVVPDQAASDQRRSKAGWLFKYADIVWVAGTRKGEAEKTAAPDNFTLTKSAIRPTRRGSAKSMIVKLDHGDSVTIQLQYCQYMQYMASTRA